MAQIYKTFTKTDLATKGTTPATTSQKQQITEIINNFIAYFKLKHM
jgi:hypothetical protein